MLIQSLIGGFLSILTPSVFFILILLMIAFNNFNTTTKLNSINIIGFSMIVIGLYAIWGLLISNYSIDIFSITNSNISIKILLTILNLVFGLWVFGVIRIKAKNIVIKRLLWIMIVLVIGITFSFSTLSSTYPILGAIIVSTVSGNSLMSVILPLFGFAFGLTVSVGLILIFTSRLIKRLSNKKWWNFFRISLSSLYIILVLIGLISYINVA